MKMLLNGSRKVVHMLEATPLINTISHLVVGLNGDVATTTTVKKFESSSF